jgi:hypothetical protein|tara:strand:+ start:361 stop:600 length:240 start_codon:yes stop_codon:yes gene_type:complete
MSRKEKIDYFLKRWISRKLTVFIVASFGLFSDVITSSDWVIIATVYISIQGASDLVEKLFKAKKSDSPIYNPYSTEEGP